MNNWSAKPSKGGLIGIALTVLAFGAFGFVTWLTVSNALETTEDDPTPGVNPGTFGLGLAACALALVVVLLAYRTWRFYQLRYYLDRNAIKIELGGKQQFIPLANVRQVLPAETLLDEMRQQAYGGEASPSTTGKREDGVKFQAYSQPRAQTVTANRVETTSAADSSVDEDLGEVEVARGEATEAGVVDAEVIEAEVIEPETVEEVAAADGGSNLDFRSIPLADGSDDEAVEPAKPVEKTAHTVPKHVAFKVKTKLLTSWPGFYTNRGTLAALGEVQFYSTRSFPETLLVRTDTRTYAISPSDPKQFIIEYRLRRNLGAIEPVEEEIVRGRFLSHPLWTDKLSRALIALGVLANLALFAFLLWRYPDLPPIMRMHYNKFGTVDRLEPASAILLLPAIGLLAAITNSVLGAWLHLRERVPALLLYGSILIVQLMVWVAAIGIIATSGA